MRSKTKYLIIGSVVLFIVAIEWRRAVNGRAMADEHYAFLELWELARRMIVERASGVMTGARGDYIVSFDDFLRMSLGTNLNRWAIEMQRIRFHDCYHGGNMADLDRSGPTESNYYFGAKQYMTARLAAFNSG